MHWLVHSSASASRGFFICKLNRDPQNLYKWIPPKIGDVGVFLHWCGALASLHQGTVRCLEEALLLKRRAR